MRTKFFATLPLVVFSVGLLSISLGSCLSDDLPGDRTLPHPLRSLSFHSEDEIFVGAAAGVSLIDLVDLSAFERLRPGMTANEAQAILGPPQRVFEEYRGYNTVYVFPGTGGAIEVFKQRVDSEGFEGVRWFLRWRPTAQDPKLHLNPEVLSSISEIDEITTLHLNSEDGAATVELENGLIRSILWVRKGALVDPFSQGEN